MASITKKIRLPQQEEILGRVSGKHTVVQVRHKECFIDAKITSYQVERTKGILVETADRKIFITQKATQPPAGITELLVIKRGFNLEDVHDFCAEEVGAKWHYPNTKIPSDIPLTDSERYCTRVRDTWQNQFFLKEEVREGNQVMQPGLRPPQIGAIYASLAHWKISLEPATVVMPTGTGKTDTMVALLLGERLSRLMVVVPTSALRDQLARKFTTLGFFRDFKLVSEKALDPVVGILRNKPKTSAEVDEIFRRCNVIITTMAVAGQCEPLVQKRMAYHCSHLFIDEAHHVSAETWNGFRESFQGKVVLQFTATPFRTDGKHVQGKIIFNYPLAKAQREGFFQPINFRPVSEFNVEKADRVIAQAAIGQLTEDLKNHDHIVMARASSILRATEILKIYEELAPEFGPLLIHSNQGSTANNHAFKRLADRACRIVVCVDMLGEGFDFPELKIAAIHDMHKSLAITLQFTGRFTRSKEKIGEASMIANIADPQVEDSLTHLYAEDADWNLLLRGLSEGATEQQVALTAFLKEFTNPPENIPLQNIFPKMSTVVYRTSCRQWAPQKADIESSNVVLHAGPTINFRERVLLYITKETESVPWGMVKGVQNTTWHLYLAHWNSELGLLFIHSSNNGSEHVELARSLAGNDVALVRGEDVYRALHGINRLMLMNLGLSHSIGRAVRFSMFVGSDITPGLSEAHGQNKIKSNLFGRGFENGQSVTIGCSRKGRIWSYKIAYSLDDWVRWCGATGKKLVDTAISTDLIFKSIILPEKVERRPDLVPLTIEWPEEFFMRGEEVVQFDFGIGGLESLIDVDLQLSNNDPSGPIRFQVIGSHKSVEYEIKISKSGATYDPVTSSKVDVVLRGRRFPLSEVFEREIPVVRFEDGSFLAYNELFKIPSHTRHIFDFNKVDTWDWTGINLKKESQTVAKLPDSIQRKVIEEILSRKESSNYQIVFNDDGTGEAADVVTFSVVGKRLKVELYHLKFSQEASPGARVEDLYAVCGQAQRSVHWRSDVEGLLRHLLRREAAYISSKNASRFELGSDKDVRTLLRQCRVLTPEFKIYVVQPGFSKGKSNQKIAELLAASELYMKETYAIEFGVIASA